METKRMRNVTMKAIQALGLFGLILPCVVLSQTEDDEYQQMVQAVNGALATYADGSFRVEEDDAIVEVDTATLEEIKDPYGTLSNCWLVTATSMPRSQHVVGVYRNGSFLWVAAPMARDPGMKKGFSASLDLNNDGTVEFIARFTTGSQLESEEWWIYSWNGQTAAVVNDVKPSGFSAIRMMVQSHQFIDINGDGILEIRGDIGYADGQGFHVEREATYSWNGSLYGEWPDGPSPAGRKFTVANNLQVGAKCVVDRENDSLKYVFSLRVASTSVQALAAFFVRNDLRSSYEASAPWEGGRLKMLNLTEFSSYAFEATIPPGGSTVFVIKNLTLPTISTYHAQGPHEDFLSVDRTLEQEMNDLRENLETNSYRGTTIGCAAPPETIRPLDFLDTLVSYTTQSRALDWIRDQSTTDKYLAYFASARTLWESNDISALRTTLNQILADVNADSSSTLTSEAYSLLRFNTEYLLEHLPSSEGGFPYSLFATHSMHLEQNSEVYSGGIGVNASGTAPFLDSQVELSVGIGTSIASGCTVKANRIKVKQGSVVSGEVFYNVLDNNGTVTGAQHTPLSLPLCSTLPEFKSATPGTQDVTVPQNNAIVVQPGNYRDIQVRGGGTLTFTAGVYHLASLSTGDRVRLLFRGPSEVRIAGKFDADQDSYIGPEDTTSLSAGEIVFYIEGINGTNGNLQATPKAARIGIGNTVKASFYVPNGTLWIRQNSRATGTFIAKDLDIGIGVKVWMQGAL